MSESALLRELRQDAAKPGAESAPTALLQVLAGIDDPIHAINDHDRCNDLFTALYEQFPFLQRSRMYGTLSDDERSHWIGLVRWLARGLNSWHRRDDPRHRQLIALLIAIQAHRAWGNPCLDVFSEGLKNEEFLGALQAVVQSTRIEMTPRGSAPLPIWEQETIEALTTADADCDWVAVERIWPMFENAVQPDDFLSLAVECLAKWDFERLVRSVSSIKQTTSATMLAGALAIEDRLRVAVASENPHIRFCFVLHSLRDTPSSQRFPDAERALLTEILVKQAGDEAAWRTWMQAINRFPVRYPALQVPLGRALAEISPTALNIYVESIELSTGAAAGRQEVADCLAAFRGEAAAEQRHQLWRLAHGRWLDWNFDRRNAERLISGISRSELDFAVVGYAVECLDAAARDKHLQGLLLKLESVENDWHSSFANLSSAWHRILSQFQPFAHATTNIAEAGNWLATKEEYRPTACQHAYLRLRFPSK